MCGLHDGRFSNLPGRVFGLRPYVPDEIVAEARRWLGTPYRHMGDVRGVGVDCAMLLVRVFCDLGLAPAFDPRPYPPDWHMHRSQEKYLSWVARYADQVTAPAPGDLALYRFGRCVSHGAIVIDDNLMIHAHRPARCVELTELRVLAHRLAGYWRVR